MFVLAFAEGGNIQLVPDGTLFIHIALILLMIWILNRTFFRPVNRIIREREKHKGGKGGEAEGILQEVAEKHKKYDTAMLEARTKGYELIEKERNKILTKHQAEIAQVKAEVSKTLAREKEELSKQTAEAKAEIAEEAEKMAEQISKNLLKAA